MPKTDIHPKYHAKAKIKCACGAVYAIGATNPEIEVEICSNCHPFYTGEKKLLDTAGRVEKFKSRQKKASDEPVKSKREKKAIKSKKKKAKQPEKVI